MENKQERRIMRLQKWLLENYDDWMTICGQGKYPITEHEFMVLMDKLERAGFEEITLVLLQIHAYAVEKRMDESVRAISELTDEQIRQTGQSPQQVRENIDAYFKENPEKKYSH